MYYQPIPVETAAAIARDFGKSIVVINTWDDAHALLHTTTFGVTPGQKRFAADAGVLTAQALGAVLQQSITYEDFRITEFHNLHYLRPIAEYDPDNGPVLWWVMPVDEPPYVGTPQDEDWPGYHTYWSPCPNALFLVASDGAKVVR